MKKYIFTSLTAVVAIVLLGLTSCSDLLDQKPQGKWQGESNLEGEIFKAYGSLRGFNLYGGTPPLAVHNFRSEDAEKGSMANDGAAHEQMFDNFAYNATNGLIEGYWEDRYKVIHTTNNVFHLAEQIEKEEGKLSEYNRTCKAEAHFIRALMYFDLVRAFGEVPLIDFYLSEDTNPNVPKSSADKIYELIDKDLEEAVKYLPTSWSKYPGRLTWGAARSLQARTYMMRNDWPKMYAAANDVVSSNLYNLNTPFEKIFREVSENGSESIFEIQCTATADKPGSNDIGSQHAAVQGVRGAGDWNLGWGWHTPTTVLANAFEQNDPRKDETLLYFAKSADEAKQMIPNKPYGEKPIANGAVINAFYNKKAYTDPSLRSKYTKGGYWFNIRLIRYADVVLMAAESALETGNIDAALKHLESVRARARGANPTVLPEVTTRNVDQLREAIHHERRIELAMEWDRFYDLVRWGTASQVLHAAGKTEYKDKHALLPIPQKMVDNSNGVLIQNPNYR